MAPPSSSSRTIDAVRTAAALYAIYLLAQVLWKAQALVLAAFLGVLFALAVNAGVNKLAIYRIPRMLAAVGIVLVAGLGIFGVGAAMAPAIREQATELRTRIPESVDRASEWLGKRGIHLFATPDSIVAPRDSAAQADSVKAKGMRQAVEKVLTNVTPYVFPFLSQTVAVVGGLFMIVFLAIYIGADPKTYHNGLMNLFPREARARAGEVLSAIASVLRKWLVTQLIAMVAIGLVTTIVLSILKVKAAIALGLLAGLLEFVPTLGPLLSAVPAIAMAFLDSPQKALLVALAYMGIQFLENNVLIPQLMKSGVDVPPVLTIIAQALLTLLFGFLGLMVAVPLMAAALVAFRMLYVEPEPILVLADTVPPVPPSEPDDSAA